MRNKSLFLVLIAATILAACTNPNNETATTGGDTAMFDSESFKKVDSNTYSGGQPSPEQLTAMKKAGIKTIINLRPHSEISWNEAKYAKELGINYINIPVANASEITPENAVLLQNTIKENNHSPLLVHCGSGNRVGALISVAEATLNGATVEGAILEGKRWGLTNLEPKVRSLLEKP